MVRTANEMTKENGEASRTQQSRGPPRIQIVVWSEGTMRHPIHQLKRGQSGVQVRGKLRQTPQDWTNGEGPSSLDALRANCIRHCCIGAVVVAALIIPDADEVRLIARTDAQRLPSTYQSQLPAHLNGLNPAIFVPVPPIPTTLTSPMFPPNTCIPKPGPVHLPADPTPRHRDRTPGSFASHSGQVR